MKKSKIDCKKWVLTPKPYDDELFSSFLARIAFCHYSNWDSLFIKYWSGTNYRRVDVDAHNYSHYFWEVLSAQTGQSIERLFKMRLNQYEGFIDEDVSHNAKSYWIVPSGHKDKVKNKFYNIRYCPECLKEEPYFKLEWRLLYVSICFKHRVYLLADCPECHENIKLKHINVFQDITTCNCGYDLREAPKKKVKRKDVWTQAKINTIATDGYFILDDKEEHSLGFFYVLRLLTTKIIETKKLPYSHIEEYTPKEIAYILTNALAILDDWPNSFIRFCKEEKYTHRATLLNKHRNTPFWFERGLDVAINTRYRKSEGEVDSMFKWIYKYEKTSLKEIQEISGWNFTHGAEMRKKWLKVNQ